MELTRIELRVPVSLREFVHAVTGHQGAVTSAVWTGCRRWFVWSTAAAADGVGITGVASSSGPALHVVSCVPLVCEPKKLTNV